ncbi:hypothetical protein ACWD4P_20905 [Kitasatospora sp. NPDC002543]
MQTDHAHDHSRDGVRRFSVPLDDAEKRADAAAVASLYDAAIDDCHECLRELLGRVARDAAATACLAGWVCLIMSETYGGFPDELLEYNGPDSAAFNRMAKVYQQVFGHPTDVVYGTCEQLTVEERGTACVWALGLLLAPDPYEAGLPAPEDCCPDCAGNEDGDILVITDDGITRIPGTPA